MFNKILYINLDRRPDREINIQNELKKINFNGSAERIKAVDGRELTRENISKKLFTDEASDDIFDNNKGMYYILTKGAAGCAMSHYNIYQKIIAESNDSDKILILEDDVKIADNFIPTLKAYLKEIPDYDILFLGYHLQTTHSQELYNPVEKIWGLFGYIINKKAALEISSVYPLKHQIDTEMPKIFKNLKVFSLREDLRLITSDESQNTNSQFGSDAQIREGFNNMSSMSSISDKINIILVIILAFLYYTN
jgi:glycosyl transferase family 25